MFWLFEAPSWVSHLVAIFHETKITWIYLHLLFFLLLIWISSWLVADTFLDGNRHTKMLGTLTLAYMWNIFTGASSANLAFYFRSSYIFCDLQKWCFNFFFLQKFHLLTFSAHYFSFVKLVNCKDDSTQTGHSGIFSKRY